MVESIRNNEEIVVNRPIRILSVIHELGWAGDETRMLNMSEAIDRDRFEHLVLRILDRPNEDHAAGFGERERQYRKMGVEVKSLSQELPEPSTGRQWLPNDLYAKVRTVRRARRLARFIRQWQADVVDARTAAGMVSVLAGRMTQTPVSITLYQGPGWNHSSWPWTQRCAVRMAHRVITDSQIRGKEFRAELGRQAQKVVVIPNGIAQPKSAHGRQEARRIFGLPDDLRIRVITQVGRLIDYKGQPVFLRAARKVVDEESNTAFLIVGYTEDEHYRTTLNRLVEELGLAERVRIVPYPESIGDVWRATDIHAHASLFDSQPIAVIEGMSLAMPAVVTSAGGIPEMVDHRRTGLVVPPGDSEALAAAILELLRDEELARKLGAGARQLYEQRHRPEFMAAALQDVFVEMIASRRGNAFGRTTVE